MVVHDRIDTFKKHDIARKYIHIDDEGCIFAEAGKAVLNNERIRKGVII